MDGGRERERCRECESAGMMWKGKRQREDERDEGTMKDDGRWKKVKKGW